MMHEWKPTREELQADWWRANVCPTGVAPVECDARIAFHDNDQEAVKVMAPTPRFIGILMHGGYIRHVRVSREEDGRPVYEGTGELLGPMTYEQAVRFVAWKDLPRGVNNFEIITTDDLPRIHGDIDLARKFRSAWALEEV